MQLSPGLIGATCCLCVRASSNFNITKTRLFKYIEKITSKNWKFSEKKNKKKKNSDIFHISAQNIDCG